MTSRRPGRLVRLDAAVVPRLAAALRSTIASGRDVAGATGRPGRMAARIVRRNPTITAAVLSVAVAVTLIASTGGDDHHAVAPPRPAPVVATLPGNDLGPISGEQVSAYLAVAKQRQSLLGNEATARPVTAVVDFVSYLTPAAVSSTFAGVAGVAVTTAFAAAAPPLAGQIHPIALTAGSDLASSLATLHSQAASLQSNYARLAALARHHLQNTRYQTLVAEYRPRAQEAKIDAMGLGATRGCVFAVEVSGPAAQLARLATLTEVRVLDPAPIAVPVSSLMIVPLEPQVTTVVPALDFAGT